MWLIVDRNVVEMLVGIQSEKENESDVQGGETVRVHRGGRKSAQYTAP